MKAVDGVCPSSPSPFVEGFSCPSDKKGLSAQAGCGMLWASRETGMSHVKKEEYHVRRKTQSHVIRTPPGGDPCPVSDPVPAARLRVWFRSAVRHRHGWPCHRIPDRPRPCPRPRNPAIQSPARGHRCGATSLLRGADRHPAAGSSVRAAGSLHIRLRL